MTNPYRAMCAELVDAVEQARQALEGWANYGQWVWPESALEQAKRNTTEALALLNRALALLDQPVAEGPTDEELLESAAKALGYGSIPNDETCQMIEAGELLSFARAVLTRWGRPTPQPPAAGEVAELVEWLRKTGKFLHPDYSSSQVPYMRVADLLQRLESDNAGLTAAADSLYFDNISLLDIQDD